MKHICFFIGHRDAPQVLLPLLEDNVERYIAQYGVREFLVGHYGNFDRLATSAVKSAKKKHPEIKLTMLLPYHPAIQQYEPGPGFDGSLYPPDMERVPRRVAIVKANEYAIRNCGFLICYNRNQIGNTRKLIEMALRRQAKGEMHVENLAESPDNVS